MLFFAGATLSMAFPGVNTISSGFTFTDTTTWRHIVLVRNAGTTRVYIDAVLQSGTSTVTGTTPTTNAKLGGSNSTNSFNGGIDEAAFWTKALTTTEISDLFNGGSGNIFTPAVFEELLLCRPTPGGMGMWNP